MCAKSWGEMHVHDNSWKRQLIEAEDRPKAEQAAS
jgi:hypothetical protein